MRDRLWTPLMVIAALLSLASTSFGQASADASKAMLSKAVAAVRTDRAKALDMFNKGEGGFRDGDLYVFCVTASDGKFVATGNPNSKKLLGVDIKTLKDVDGNPINVNAATQKPDGEITTIDYEFSKPKSVDKQVPKETYITKVGDLICGVGYYYFTSTQAPSDLE